MKKVCVVTGGGSGIGFATAKEVAEKGYYVILVGRNKKKLEGAVEILRTLGAKQKHTVVMYQTEKIVLHLQSVHLNVEK
ncbi:short subunit dehydrogenase [Faecalimonas umbilicata]|uniref:Short subunit dehydrogenase n=1 Tax=Faecalimonas umbilicata TaxID=1912855 RepID=A0A4R3J5C8_9FIRM|nr:short subunit dehydrogenase [Faecalimonas umbilicata]GBU06126.1 hypothetical protein FAEUMB_26670 [Faecalimonas umbilicata]